MKLRTFNLPAMGIILISLTCTAFGSYSATRAAASPTFGSQNTTIGQHTVTPTALTIKVPDLQQPAVPHDTAPDYAIPPVLNGLAPVLTHIPTEQSVVFLGIDDGKTKLAGDLKLLQDNHIKASLYLANTFIEDDPGYFMDFVTAGLPIENHSVSHRLMSHLSYAEQRQEICAEADLQEQQFGRRPIFFRPPGGDYNVYTQRAAADCGMKAIVNWIAKANGGSMQYQVGDHLRPGDIVLMHFRPEFAADLKAFVDAENAAGLHTVLLEDWLSD